LLPQAQGVFCKASNSLTRRRATSVGGPD
jgi:pyridoxamine 5'-phosphate oxidase-like protein